MSKNEERFEIAPEEDVVVGTQILDPTLPSNLDFDQSEKPAIEMVEIKAGQAKQQQPSALGKIDLENLDIRSYSVKGKVVFNLAPQHPVGSLLPANTRTYPVKCFNEESSGGLRGLWQAVVGYSSREMVVQQGFIYLLTRQGGGLAVTGHWRLVDIFKIFLDYEQSKLRLVLREQGSEHLMTRDYQSGQIRQLVQRLGAQMNAVGLSLIG